MPKRAKRSGFNASEEEENKQCDVFQCEDEDRDRRVVSHAVNCPEKRRKEPLLHDKMIAFMNGEGLGVGKSKHPHIFSMRE